MSMETGDSLLPPEIARKAEDVGVAKGRMPAARLFTLAVLAGAFISLGGMFSTVAMTGAAAMPWGVGRVLGGLTFCLGLVLVVVAGAELFTGNNLIVMAVASGKLPLRLMLRNWAIVYAGNFAGSLATAAMVFFSSHHTLADGQAGLLALKIAQAKCLLTFPEALVRGVLCNALVCLAVWLCLSCRNTGERILAVVFPVTAFVAAGFEHCVANMYLAPLALFIKAGAGDAFWSQIGARPESFQALTWPAFLLGNLLPVTLGNIVGGSALVGGVYWMAYQRPQEKP